MLRIGEVNYLRWIYIFDGMVTLVSYLVGNLIVYPDSFGEVVWFRGGCVCVLLSYSVVAHFSHYFKKFLEKGYWRRLFAIFKLNIYLEVIFLALFLLMGVYQNHTWQFYMTFLLCNILLMYGFHLVYRMIIVWYYKSENRIRKVLMLTTYEIFHTNMREQQLNLPLDCSLIGAILLDESPQGKGGKNLDIPIVASKDQMYDYIREHVVDEVFISVSHSQVSDLEQMIINLQHMGIVVNLNMQNPPIATEEKITRKFGNYYVLTYSLNAFGRSSVALKRVLDIIGSMFGLIFTALLFAFVAPLIYLESPGPIFFSQMRVGRSGRRFKIYKFRSMYLDAEERKAELMAQNEMNGPIFKMDNDPRITKVGNIIRRFSIDEFPQFWNVLKGEMSLVGTRPPTVDEFLQYTNEQKQRLTLKPGLTGLWQVSGRSDITDFEEIMKLDLEYLERWWIGKDMKVLLKTVRVVLQQKGVK